MQTKFLKHVFTFALLNVNFKTMTKIFLSVLLLFTFSVVNAQENYKSGKSLTVQMDAFDFMAKGFSIWTAYTFNYNRIFIDGGMNELPDFLNPQKDDFYETRKFFIQGGYYRFLKKPDGLFIGIEGIFQKMEIKAKASNEKKDNPVFRVAPVIGYEWAPFKTKAPKFTITPWISERFPIYSKSVAFSSTTKTYKTADFNFVMGLNLGYRFGNVKKE
jgi:hypothetical protein